MVDTKLAPRRQQFHVVPAMQQPNSAVSISLRYILKIRAIKGYSHSFRIACDMNAVIMFESREIKIQDSRLFYDLIRETKT